MKYVFLFAFTVIAFTELTQAAEEAEQGGIVSNLNKKCEEATKPILKLIDSKLNKIEPVLASDTGVHDGVLAAETSLLRLEAATLKAASDCKELAAIHGNSIKDPNATERKRVKSKTDYKRSITNLVKIKKQVTKVNS